MMEDQLEVQPLQMPVATETEAASDDLYGSAGYLVRTDLRAGSTGRSDQSNLLTSENT